MGEPVAARPFGQADDPVAEHPPILGGERVDGDEVGGHLGDRRLDLAGLLRELLVAAGAGPEEDLERVTVVGDESEVGLEPRLDLLPWPRSVGGRLGDAVAELAADLAEQLPVELALGGEVLVQHGLGHPGGLGDIVHRGLVEALRREHAQGAVEELLTPFGGRETHAGPKLPDGNQRESGADTLLGVTSRDEMCDPDAPIRKRKLTRSLACVALSVLMMTLVLACGRSQEGSASDDSVAASTAVTSAAPTTALTTAAPSTTVFVPTAFLTPAAAGTALFGAWTKDDRAAAGSYAQAGQLDALFAVPSAGARNRGCDDGAFGGVANCFFGLRSGGGVSVGLNAAAAGGWAIATIDVNP